MKKLIVNIGLLVSIITFLPLTSYSQWEMSTGLDGGEITSMVSVDSMLFASTDYNGIYGKCNNCNWELAYSDKRYTKLINVGNCVIAYDHWYGNNPIRTFDYGETWHEVSTLDDPNNMWSIDTVLFSKNNYTYALRSLDYGDTHDTITFPIQDINASLLCDDSLLFLHYWVDEFHKLYVSSDLGLSWDSITTNGLFVNQEIGVNKLKFLNGTYWAQLNWAMTGYAPKTVHMFDNNLNKWVDASTNLPSFSTHHDLFEFNGNILCSVGAFPVFKYDYEESSWVQFADASKTVNQFLQHNDELFCATNQGACSLDTVGFWTTYYTGLQHRNITSVDEQDGIIYVTANNELFYSENGGDNFVRNENAYGFQVITTDSVFYTISAHDYRMSWDEGDTWYSFSDSLEDQFDRGLTHLSISPNYYYLGTGRGLFRSPSASIEWTKVENGPFNSNFIVQNVEAIQHTVYVGEYLWAQKLYFSLNNGFSFNEFGDYKRLSKVDQSYYLLGDSIYYSDNLGFVWDTIAVIPTGNSLYCIDRKEDTIIIGGRDPYGNPIVKIAYAEGGYFYDIIDNLPEAWGVYSTGISELKIVDGRIFVENPKHGLWYRDDILTGTIENPTSYFSNNTFINVYPNPLSLATTFEYTLEQTSSIQITIYNHIGEQVDLIQQNQSSGKQQITWNAEGLPSGIYYYRMQAGDQVASGKMVLVR